MMGHSTVFMIRHHKRSQEGFLRQTYRFLSLLPFLCPDLSMFFTRIPAPLLLIPICHEQDVQFLYPAILIRRYPAPADVPGSSCTTAMLGSLIREEIRIHFKRGPRQLGIAVDLPLLDVICAFCLQEMYFPPAEMMLTCSGEQHLSFRRAGVVSAVSAKTGLFPKWLVIYHWGTTASTPKIDSLFSWSDWVYSGYAFWWISTFWTGSTKESCGWISGWRGSGGVYAMLLRRVGVSLDPQLDLHKQRLSPFGTLIGFSISCRCVGIPSHS